MALDSGLTVLVCSIFFVFLALLKQNVLIFVSQNLDDRSPMNAEQRALFEAYDLDYNGVIDQDEFLFIAANIIPQSRYHTEIDEPELEETYIKINVEFSGSSNLANVSKEIEFNTKTFALFVPSSVELGYTWVLYKGTTTSPTSYYATPLRSNYAHYPLYQIFSAIHWNAVLDSHYRTPLSSAIVTAISDSHVRVNFVISVEYQLGVPPSKPQWFALCRPCETNQTSCDPMSCQVVGEAIFTRDLQLLEYFVVNCGGSACQSAGNKVRISSDGGSYQYKIQQNKLVSVPFDTDDRVSHEWFEELAEWGNYVLNDSRNQ